MFRFSADKLAQTATEFNQQLCSLTGEPHFVREPGLLLGAVGRPLETWGGDLLYGSVTLRAAVLTSGIAGSHPFAQGNKRTAWMMGLFFIQGYEWDLENIGPDESERQVLSLIDHSLSEEGYSAWLASHLVKLK
ncbi:type II toxin-antitoxin system death-on-curing family toxin [Schaalia sp. JY-X169]|uniref:type II toxin-antitoxin system death-on-curing family toxin n=1 Tax=Schaalia sp. JY-X169 TaxID=2758572 RepID=UPI0037D9EE42